MKNKIIKRMWRICNNPHSNDWNDEPEHIAVPYEILEEKRKSFVCMRAGWHQKNVIAAKEFYRTKEECLAAIIEKYAWVKKHDDRELEKLWRVLGDIPVNDNGETEESFIDFPPGTQREDIWQWFDEKYSRGVVALLNPESVARKVCSRCGSDVLPEEDEELKKEYPYYCPECDENMYSFECKDKGVMENESNCSAGSGRKTSGGNGPGL